ncbi:hypothetical protein ACFV5G_20265 [Streptomyces sp. NPDC059766]|uniref:hypothetical protein n=1 Tax=Streptomyces sp. NPDC059766 TaxID=3346940 RepID=UPI0036520981
MSQQGGRPTGHEDDWWRQLYDDSTEDTGPVAAADSLDDRFASAAGTLGEGTASPESGAARGAPPRQRAPWEPLSTELEQAFGAADLPSAADPPLPPDPPFFPGPDALPGPEDARADPAARPDPAPLPAPPSAAPRAALPGPPEPPPPGRAPDEGPAALPAGFFYK